MRWFIREYHDDDLEAVVRLLDATSAHQGSVYGLSEVIAALRDDQPAMVALLHDEVVGAVVSAVSGDRAWVARLAIAEEWRGKGMASALLLGLERVLLDQRVRTLSYVLSEEEQLADGLVNAGFARRSAVAYFDKVVSVDAHEADVLAELGGQVLPGRLWDDLAGMHREKDLIERRVVAPLDRPETASRHGVQPPRAIVLFGPPGTGKTSFARGIASRLGWPFVEVLPSALLADPAGPASALRATFDRIRRLEKVLVFIDEVEEIAAVRGDAPTSPIHGLTNELLKVVPAFRQHDERLLVCATNDLRALDPAFTRPGRFDYVIPIGTPDDAARAAIWRRYADASAVDIDRLVAASASLTPAEIEHAARSASQASFERAVFAGVEGDGPTTDDYLAALAQVKPSVTEQVRAAFADDVRDLARL
ncbi:MAG: ATP-binding protein [Actinobacteria bacterium]|jgi:GNAT superfamily N-acetyltransferase|nr:ATP-binding protein [Actinomycetota bacterium]